LGEVVELQFDERLAGAVTAVEPRHPPCQLLQQLGKTLQAGGQIRQIAVVGIFHADRLTPALDLHRALVDAMGEPPEPFAEGAEITQQILAIARTQVGRSEEHTSELQSRENLVCRLLLEKKKKSKT